MAYPFIQLPTFHEFIARLTSEEFGCTFKTATNPMTDADGESHGIHYLEREVAGDTATYVLHIEDFQEHLTPSLVRSVCARFEIDSAKFGLDLG